MGERRLWTGQGKSKWELECGQLTSGQRPRGFRACAVRRRSCQTCSCLVVERSGHWRRRGWLRRQWSWSGRERRGTVSRAEVRWCGSAVVRWCGAVGGESGLGLACWPGARRCAGGLNAAASAETTGKCCCPGVARRQKGELGEEEAMREKCCQRAGMGVMGAAKTNPRRAPVVSASGAGANRESTSTCTRTTMLACACGRAGGDGRRRAEKAAET